VLGGNEGRAFPEWCYNARESLLFFHRSRSTKVLCAELHSREGVQKWERSREGQINRTTDPKQNPTDSRKDLWIKYPIGSVTLGGQPDGRTTEANMRPENCLGMTEKTQSRRNASSDLSIMSIAELKRGPSKGVKGIR
jgi:hypothetical protein